MWTLDDLTTEQREALLRLVNAEVERFSREEAVEKARARLLQARREYWEAEADLAARKMEKAMSDG